MNYIVRWGYSHKQPVSASIVSANSVEEALKVFTTDYLLAYPEEYSHVVVCSVHNMEDVDSAV